MVPAKVANETSSINITIRLISLAVFSIDLLNKSDWNYIIITTLSGKIGQGFPRRTNYPVLKSNSFCFENEHIRRVI